jgi:2-oxoglutarate ferredoxin oxidoreductase subunit delta
MQRINIAVQKCKGCTLCITVCPKKCLEMSKDFNKKGYHTATFKDEGTCTSCGFCYQVCPDVCIEVYK